MKCYNDITQNLTSVALGRVQNLGVLKESITNVNNANGIEKHANWCVKLKGSDPPHALCEKIT